MTGVVPGLGFGAGTSIPGSMPDGGWITPSFRSSSGTASLNNIRSRCDHFGDAAHENRNVQSARRYAEADRQQFKSYRLGRNVWGTVLNDSMISFVDLNLGGVLTKRFRTPL